MEGPKRIYVYCGMSVYATERKSKDQTKYIRDDLVEELIEASEKALKYLSKFGKNGKLIKEHTVLDKALAALKAVEG